MRKPEPGGGCCCCSLVALATLALWALPALTAWLLTQ
jgi:hypothetical protein